MSIQIVQSLAGPDRTYAVGEVVTDFPPAEAERLVVAGYAVKVQPPRQATPKRKQAVKD